MKKILILLGLILLTFTSCHDTDYLSVMEQERAKLVNEYKESFTETFGEYGVLNIDPQHNWGFHDYVDSTIIETRSVNPNSNEWYVVPEEITLEEKEYVTNWFNTHIDPLFYGINTDSNVKKLQESVSVNWSDYFVQQVSSNHPNMDKLIVSKDGKNMYDHVYNFNSANGTIQLMQNSTSNHFGYHNSLDSKDHYEYTIQFINGSFYVGFDFYANGQNPNQQEDRDGFYSDWIVKITPCIPKDDSGIRIMAEDLGSIGDFDFNDVVFDVYIYYNQWWHGNDFGIIVLRAAGGTMPLYVDDHEVHNEFGVDISQMVNTSNGTVSRPIVIWNFKPKTPNPIDIPILVDNKNENLKYTISSKIGEAPGKIAVPTNVEWSKERINIKETYPKFTYWIEDQTQNFW